MHLLIDVQIKLFKARTADMKCSENYENYDAIYEI